MPYALGIDLGTTFTAAAVASDGRAEIVALGNRSPAMPSVVLLRADGEVLTGEVAERRGQSEPTRTAREFKRRLGDPAPLLLGGTPYGVETLTAHLLRAVVAQVVELRGETPDRIVVCHPASYGPFKLDLLEQAARIAEVGAVSFVSEPEAAAVHYASQERVLPGEHIAVYDFGGGTFDAAVLRKTQDGFELLGVPEGLERLGGIDFDQAVFAHVARALGGAIETLDGDDPAVINALARLREECRDAKEALSVDTDAQIPVMLPNVQTEVRLTRSEFEALVRPRVTETVGALRRAIRSAGLQDADVSRILLVGGSSRIPLVGQLVREGTGRPTALDAHPKHAVALGAALVGGSDMAHAQVATNVMAAVQPGPTGDFVAPATESKVRARRRGMLVAIAVVAVLAGVGAAFAVAGGGDSEPSSASSGASSSETDASSMTTAAAATTSATTSATTTPATTTPATTTPATTTPPTTTPATTTPPTTGSTDAGSAGLGGRLVSIQNAKVQGDHYVIDFTSTNFQPSDEAGGYQARFYFVRSTDLAAMIYGAASAEIFEDYAGASPFTGLEVADRPSDADQICGAVVDSAGQPSSLSGNCVLIPA